MSEETKKKIGDANRGNPPNSGSFKKGHIVTLEHRKKVSLAQKGKKHTKEWKRRMSERTKGNKYRLGIPETEEKKIKHSIFMKEYIKKHPEWIKACLRRRKMSSLEIKMNDFIKKHNIPYRFVGNGEVIIGRKCPDFINTNGEKIAIEVYYRRHKEQIGQAKGKTIEDWKQERQEIFNKYGWKIKYFDETEVNEEELTRRGLISPQ